MQLYCEKQATEEGKDQAYTFYILVDCILADGTPSQYRYYKYKNVTMTALKFVSPDTTAKIAMIAQVEKVAADAAAAEANADNPSVLG